jgi:radical SAM superfamily enzyme YgiQ (UPF0313 family)
MRILLISVNRERMPYPVFPLGLAYIASVLGEGGHQLRILDLCFCEDVEEEMKVEISRWRPDLIGLSLRNLDNLTYPTSLSYLPELEEVVTLCRSYSKARIVIGGSGFSLAPLEIMRSLEIDFGVVGEGENPILSTVRCLERGIPVKGIPGMIVRADLPEKVPPIDRVKVIGFPQRDLLDNGRYLHQGGMGNIQTKRGCPFGCIYCTYPFLEGSSVRMRPVKDVLKELRVMKERYGVDYVYFVDDIFNFPQDHALGLCRSMAGERLGVKWTAFVNPGFVDEELIGSMKEAGCMGIEFGTDSGSPEMLSRLGKSFSADDISRASEICKRVGIPFAHYLLLGGPGESEKTLEETAALMDHLEPTAVIVMVGIRIYTGTPLEDISRSEGVIGPDADLRYPHFYVSPRLRDEIPSWVSQKAMERNTWIVPGLEVNISRNMMEHIRRFHVRGPLWDLVSRMKRSRVRPLSEEG